MRVPFVLLKMSISTTVCPATTVLEPPDGPSLGGPAGETVGVGLSVGDEVGVGVAEGDGELNSWAKGSFPLKGRICAGLADGLAGWLGRETASAGPGDPSATGSPRRRSHRAPGTSRPPGRGTARRPRSAGRFGLGW